MASRLGMVAGALLQSCKATSIIQWLFYIRRFPHDIYLLLLYICVRIPAGSCHMNHLPRPMYISAITCPFRWHQLDEPLLGGHTSGYGGEASEILGLRVWWSVMYYVCWTVPLRNSFHLAVIDTLIRCGQRIVCLDSQSIPHERDFAQAD